MPLATRGLGFAPEIATAGLGPLFADVVVPVPDSLDALGWLEPSVATAWSEITARLQSTSAPWSEETLAQVWREATENIPAQTNVLQWLEKRVVWWYEGRMSQIVPAWREDMIESAVEAQTATVKWRETTTVAPWRE